MTELLQQLNACFTTARNSNGDQVEQVDVYEAVKLIKQILEQLNA